MCLCSTCRETNRIAQAAVAGLGNLLLQTGPDIGLTQAKRLLAALVPFLQMAWAVPRNAKLKVWCLNSTHGTSKHTTWQASAATCKDVPLVCAM